MLERKDVVTIAHLARLSICEKDIQSYTENLTEILDFVDQMNRVDTTNVEPMAHPLDSKQRLRHDEVSETDQRAAFQAIAPDVEDGLYRVPKIME